MGEILCFRRSDGSEFAVQEGSEAHLGMVARAFTPIEALTRSEPEATPAGTGPRRSTVQSRAEAADAAAAAAGG
jgi:hypothetical protein